MLAVMTCTILILEQGFVAIPSQVNDVNVIHNLGQNSLKQTFSLKRLYN